MHLTPSPYPHTLPLMLNPADDVQAMRIQTMCVHGNKTVPHVAGL